MSGGEDVIKNINTTTTGTPDEYQELGSSGVNCGVLSESTPVFINADCETVFDTANNSYIVLGRDRPGSLNQGYGGEGHSGAGSIDLVVGRPGNSDNRVHPDFENDAARIHISQKTNIDENFKLEVRTKAVSSSGIGLKADHIRMVGRRSIKLVTNTDGSGELKNGIELIANNNSSTLQPIVKGENLEEALMEIVKRLDEISGTVATFAKTQLQFNQVAMLHIHNSPFFGIPTCPSSELATQGAINGPIMAESVISQIATFKQNLATLTKTYLSKTTPEKYINSENNKVN
jgi:hypothetical protein